MLCRITRADDLKMDTETFFAFSKGFQFISIKGLSIQQARKLPIRVNFGISEDLRNQRFQEVRSIQEREESVITLCSSPYFVFPFTIILLLLIKLRLDFLLELQF